MQITFEILIVVLALVFNCSHGERPKPDNSWWKLCPDIQGSAKIESVSIFPKALVPGKKVYITFTATTETLITGGKVEGTFQRGVSMLPAYRTVEDICSGWADCPQAPGTSTHTTAMFVPRIAVLVRKVYGRFHVIDQDNQTVVCVDMILPVRS